MSSHEVTITVFDREGRAVLQNSFDSPREAREFVFNAYNGMISDSCEIRITFASIEQ